MSYLAHGTNHRRIVAEAESYGDAAKAANFFYSYNVLIDKLISEINCFLIIRDNNILTQEQYELPKYLADLKINLKSLQPAEIERILKEESERLKSCRDKNDCECNKIANQYNSNNYSKGNVDKRIALLGPERLLLRIFAKFKKKLFRESLCSSAILHVFRTDDDVYRYQTGPIQPIEVLGSDNEFTFFIDDFIALGLLNRNVKYQQLNGFFLNNRGEPMDVSSLPRKHSNMQNTLSDYTWIRKLIDEAFIEENIPIPVRVYKEPEKQ